LGTQRQLLVEWLDLWQARLRLITQLRLLLVELAQPPLVKLSQS
jgi:hypothetical protein